MEIYNKEKDNYISVWMTREEQQLFDRQALTNLLLSTVKNKFLQKYSRIHSKTCMVRLIIILFIYH